MPTPAITDFPYSNNLRVAELVREGIPARSLKALAQALNMSMTRVSEATLIPRRTLERRIASNGRLPQPESERVVRIGRIFAKATDVFEDRVEAALWLNEPLAYFGGRTPMQLISTEAGAREVEQVLGRIEHGVFS